ncbi:MAG TPA: leucine--tRNA ligase [Methanobacteriaceae archaeon]|nr:leucine--tRNA ligase [Methanobacteriaceae archaeon]
MTDINVEIKWQKKWQKAELFHSNPDSRKKLFLTVAYPYPSGAMHVGHGRTYTVPDVYARFKRMQGYNVLFPMGWHVTGAPVIGIAKRIGRQDSWTLNIYKNVHKVPDEELEKFTDPHYIVEYFSSEYKDVMTRLGYSIDWRREFKTLDPHYQKFISWQFRKLKEKGLVRIGAHPVKYCPECQNPVGDHDLLEGEGVGINELTLVKFKFKDSYLVAATFRPETLFGATNLWLNPSEEYIKIKYHGEDWIISKKSFDNLVNQKDVEIVGDVDAVGMIGQNVQNPLTDENLIILPASFVDPEYATGVVYSVPAHAPADYIALVDLKKDVKTLETYDIKEQVEKIRPIGLIKLDGFGEYPAVEMVEKMGVKNQEDPQLHEATNEMYKLEHAKGVMDDHVTGYAGLKVPQARDAIIEILIKSQKGDKMHEFAERPVICRCGGKCVVKILEDQWFLKYSKQGWKDTTLECLNQMNAVPEEIRHNFEYFINWLHDWACSRRIGLGTRLPWDTQWLIEPLSDSTIYMAYYSIATHIRKMDPEDLNDEFFDGIFLGADYSPADSEFQNTKDEFNYWYPLDWRLSAKDLVGNHLSFHLFHHSAIFPREKWPQGVVVFGMGLLEGNKMSSSKGNIILLEDAIKTHGADVVRLFLMSSAEPWQDFDWREKEVIGTKKRLDWFLEFADRVDQLHGSQIQLKDYVDAPTVTNSINTWMVSQVNQRVKDATEALEGFQTRKALQESLFLFKKDIDHYLYRVDVQMNDPDTKEEIADVLAYVLGIWIRLLAPFTPHASEELWERHGGHGFASEAPWPEHDLELINEEVHKGEEIVQGLAEDIREIKKITKSEPEKIHIYLAPKWKWTVFEIAKNVGKPDVGQIIGRSIKGNVHDDKKEIAAFAQKIAREMTRINYVGWLDEYQLLKDSIEYLSREAGAEIIVHQDADYDPQNKARNAIPYKPAIYLE